MGKAANEVSVLTRPNGAITISSRKQAHMLHIFFCAALSLVAAPDPDLFDGRVAPPLSKQFGSNGSPKSGGEETGQSAGSSGESVGSAEAGDPEAVGGIEGGHTVQSNRSKAGFAPGGSGSAATPPSGGSESGVNAGGGSGSTTSTTDMATGSSGGVNAGLEARSFEAFGFGAASPEEAVEVRRSKESSQSASSVDASTGPSGTQPTPSAGSQAAGGSQPVSGSTIGDYGTNLPSGL